MDDSLRLTHDKEDTVYRNGYFVLYRAANDRPFIANAKFSIFPSKIVAVFIHDILTWVPKATCILHSFRTTVTPPPPPPHPPIPVQKGCITQRRKYVIFSNPVFFSGFYIGTQEIKSSGWMAFCMYTVEIHFKISTNERYAVFTHHIMLNLASKSSQTAQSH